jgi:hypothetical protein
MLIETQYGTSDTNDNHHDRDIRYDDEPIDKRFGEKHKACDGMNEQALPRGK